MQRNAYTTEIAAELRPYGKRALNDLTRDEAWDIRTELLTVINVLQTVQMRLMDRIYRARHESRNVIEQGDRMHKRTKWMVCQSPSGAFLHVSPRLASIDMRIVDIIDTEENISPEGLFDAVLDLLPAAGFPPIEKMTCDITPRH